MTAGFVICAAVLLDLVFGDPRNMPHPVRAIGSLASRVETSLRKNVGNERIAGILATVIIVGGSGAVAWLAVEALTAVSIYLGLAAQVVIIYQTIAIKDLDAHAMDVYKALAAGDIRDARRKVAMIAGRDTENLEDDEIAKACVESVAESAVDGVAAPVFFAAIGGPAAAMAYRAANTLDSMFGHKDERYIRFGWASARLDDALNYIPARITAPLVCAAAFLSGMNASGALKTWFRDGRRHESPNSGLTEAAFAGALDIRLGGRRSYAGVVYESPHIGAGDEDISRETIKKGLKLARLTSFLAAITAIGARIAVERLFTGG